MIFNKTFFKAKMRPLAKRHSVSFFLLVFLVSSIFSQTENSISEITEKQSIPPSQPAILSNPTLDKNTNRFLSAPVAVSGIIFRGLRYFTRASNQFPILVEASDILAISRIEFYVDGILLKTNSLPSNTLNALSYFNWNTISVANGKHVLQAKSFNTAGNVQTATAVVRSQNFSIPQPVGNVIALNRYVKHQIMEGWEANAETGQLYSAAWNNYKVPLLDQAVNDLGINRIRLEITSGAENPIDYFAQWRAGQITESQYNAKRYEIINDDSSTTTINPNGFKWSQLDNTIDNVVVPMRQRLQARGESLWINLNYVDFGSSTFEHKNDPAEYAEFVLATYQHMQSRYGFVPNTWEVVLEPDTSTANWSAVQVASVITVTGDRLAANGFTPRFVAPSTTSAANAPIYIDQIAQTAGAMPYVSEFSYHRYCCATGSVLQGIFDRAIQYNKRTSMLEWIGADFNTIHEDLKSGRNSSWQQFTLAGPLSWGPDSGDRYYLIDDANVTNPVISIGSRTKLLRQYFKYIRSGAQRIDALTGNVYFDPLAFINTNGKYVVVVKVTDGGSFTVLGLPAGTYGIKYTSANQYNVDSPDITLAAGQPLVTTAPPASVITIYAK
jgi:hypothetical protein